MRAGSARLPARTGGCCGGGGGREPLSCSAAHQTATSLRRVTELLEFKTGTCTKPELVTSSPSWIGAVTAPGEDASQAAAELSVQLPGGQGRLGVGTNPAILGGQSSQQRKT